MNESLSSPRVWPQEAARWVDPGDSHALGLGATAELKTREVDARQDQSDERHKRTDERLAGIEHRVARIEEKPVN